MNKQTTLALLTIAFCFFLQLVFPLNSVNGQTTTVQGAHQMYAHYKGTTKPLRDLIPLPAMSTEKRDWKKSEFPKNLPPNFDGWPGPMAFNPDALPKEGDPLQQRFFPNNGQAKIFPKLVLEGIGESESKVGVPDTNGDASPDHYVQIVNASWFKIFSKDGMALTDAISTNTIWGPLGVQSIGDPIILYDQLAERWFLAEMSSLSSVLYAISETSDPFGPWTVYEFLAPTIVDYPKFGIYPHAYLMTANTTKQDFYPVYAINRQQLLAGAGTVVVQRIDLPGLKIAFPTAAPMSWLGNNVPLSEKTYAVRLNDDAWGNGNSSDLLEVWEIQYDWFNPALSTAVLHALPAAPFDSNGCPSGTSIGIGDCINQPGTNVEIQGMMTIVMNKAHCRSFGAYESAVLNFSVNAGTQTERRSGIRWMELRRQPGQNWAIYQEGTIAPEDDDNRFMGAISINKAGDIGLGYSVSGAGTYPSLRYTGRRADDPLGLMTIDEFEFATGESSFPFEPFGHYAGIGVDPDDDSFWFTSEYIRADGEEGTKIVQFSVRKDTFDMEATALLQPKTSPDLTDQESVVIRVQNTGLEPAENFSVGYVLGNNAPVIEQAVLASPLMADSFFVHTFAAKTDMAAIGAYPISVFVTLPEDQERRNDTLHRVVRKLSRLDAGITDITGLDPFVCTENIPIRARVKNFGTEVLGSFHIEFSLNNGPTQLHHWTGNLAPGAQVEVPLQLTGIQPGNNELDITTKNPNGINDEVPSNDRLMRAFPAVTDGETAFLEITFDDYPNETSWSLRDENGQLVYERSGYGLSVAKKTITEPLCVQPGGCYTFTIFDQIGDGMSPEFGPKGSYRILDADGKVLASILQVNFGFQEINIFCLDQPCTLEAEISITPLSSGNSTDGAILVTVTSGVSPFSYSIDGGETFQADNIFDGLAGGIYSVVVQDANGCIFEQDVLVAPPVSANDPLFQAKVSVMPNPSSNGLFTVTCTGLQTNDLLIRVQVVDATGRAVWYGSLPKVDDHFSGIVSVGASPAGMYFLRFMHPQIGTLVKVVRQ